MGDSIERFLKIMTRNGILRSSTARDWLINLASRRSSKNWFLQYFLTIFTVKISLREATSDSSSKSTRPNCIKSKNFNGITHPYRTILERWHSLQRIQCKFVFNLGVKRRKKTWSVIKIKDEVEYFHINILRNKIKNKYL